MSQQNMYRLMSRKKPGGGGRKAVDIIITSLGDERLLGTLSVVVDKTASLSNGKVYLLTEENASEKVVEYARSAGLIVLLVPKEWHGGKAKGRAIWWFAQNVADENRWYMFLDDDSYPLDNRFQYDVARYDKEGKLLGNCILVPRRGRALIPHLCDNLRYADDRFSLGLVLNHLGKPVFGMHGEGMLVRGDILKQYWKDITSIAEDAEFGISAGEGTKFFRSRTEISILSPHSIGDFWKQRRRWYLGLVSILPKFPLLPRVLVGIRMLAWSLGFLSVLGWILVPYFLISGRLSSGFATMELIILSCFLFSLSFFMIGARRTKTMPQAIVLFPIYSTIGALLPLYVLLTLNRGWRFEVIDK